MVDRVVSNKGRRILLLLITTTLLRLGIVMWTFNDQRERELKNEAYFK